MARGPVSPQGKGGDWFCSTEIGIDSSGDLVELEFEALASFSAGPGFRRVQPGDCSPF
jgi:hypothetical protein